LNRLGGQTGNLCSSQGEKTLMRGWRSKLVFMLVVYFAGFATAIYALSPAPENNGEKANSKTMIDSILKSDDFAKSFNTGINKCVALGKDAAERSVKFLKQKIDERQLKSDG